VQYKAKKEEPAAQIVAPQAVTPVDIRMNLAVVLDAITTVNRMLELRRALQTANLSDDALEGQINAHIKRLAGELIAPKM